MPEEEIISSRYENLPAIVAQDLESVEDVFLLRSRADVVDHVTPPGSRHPVLPDHAYVKQSIGQPPRDHVPGLVDAVQRDALALALEVLQEVGDPAVVDVPV